MSHAEPSVWAMKDAPVADVQEFAVLLVMAESADEDGCNAFQSVATIAERSRLAEKTVKRRQADMEKRGIIVRGDQQYPALLQIRADRRPVNYDLMIPYSWWGSKWARMNHWRANRGRPDLAPEDRPDLQAAPAPTPRVDKGRRKLRAVHGGTTSPAVDVDGGTTSPAVPGPDGGTTSPVVDGGTTSPPAETGAGTGPRGDYKFRHGGTTSPPTKDLEPNQEPKSKEPPPAAPDGDRGGEDGALFGVPGPPPPPPPGPATDESRRITELTRGYVDAVPLSRYPAVRGIVAKAVRAERDGTRCYPEADIAAALTRLAGEGRTLTTDSLRVEIEGFAPRPVAPSAASARVLNGMTYTAQLRAAEQRAAAGQPNPPQIRKAR